MNRSSDENEHIMNKTYINPRGRKISTTLNNKGIDMTQHYTQFFLNHPTRGSNPLSLGQIPVTHIIAPLGSCVFGKMKKVQ